jgi:UPF0755 protein
MEPPPVESRPVELPPAEPRSVEAQSFEPRQATPPPRVERGVAETPVPTKAKRGRHSTRARAGAVLALAAAVVVVWLLLHESNGAGHSKTTPATVAEVKVLIPEGETRSQIDQIARKHGLKGSYLAASARSSRLSPARYGAPPGTASLEGFLFPATYDMLAHAPARRLVDKQLTAFRENFGGAEVTRARALHVTPYQLLTVASMVEREAKLAGDRPKVAAVIYNRLRAGMALEVDATIRYALNDFTHPLTEAQLKTESPYNTRTHRGLPPTPISNPGLASIKAAARPAHVSYLYYVAGADGCGELVFSTAYTQFQRDEAAYRQALEKNGGRVPACKK